MLKFGLTLLHLLKEFDRAYPKGMASPGEWSEG